MYYGLSKELLLDNDTNFLANVVKYYLQKLHTWDKYMTVYYLQTNWKVENLDGTLGNMLTKYLIGKPKKL